MSEQDHLSEDLVPLRLSAAGPDADPADRWLAQGFSAMRAQRDAVTGTASPAGQESGWDAIRDSARRTAQRRRRRYLARELYSLALPRRVSGMGMAAAAALLLCVLPQRSDRPSPADPVPLLRAERSEISALKQARAARLLNGAVLEIEKGIAQVEQRDREKTRVSLRSGALRLRVPRLPERGQLTVLTDDAEVIVHGTRFLVDKAGQDRTRVAVEEGLVEVRPRGGGRPPRFLRPGEETVVLSLSSYHAEIARRAERLISASRCDDGERVLDTLLELSPAGFDLSQAHYLKGFCAAQRGDHEEALRWFEQAGASADPVRADNALARAAQLRSMRDEADGAAAWRRYLARFPNGLHRLSARLALGAEVEAN
jgi:ferric-dicitrate binding protein FerR (iron transport regulator)